MLHEQLQLRWQQLNNRERLLVSLAGIVLAISVVYFALWQPLQSGIEQRQLQRDAQLETLSWVRENTGRYLALKQQSGQPQTGTTARRANELGDIPRLVTEFARAQQLDVGRMNPEGDSLVVVLNDVPFERVLALLDALQAESGLSIEQLDITRGNTPGHVHVRRLKVGLA
ncbi:type II secretion system protein M [Pseudidiomarina terrestris]|uniref:Type II secretion system protein M n=1 Tax=Pseudidiomarina terrestris TaxID=2820060 RepID=A0AAW7QX44_9GAMM|nr:MULTISPECIES: type II secretion system protein M [unclassified Pseudidiomarina]MDN7124453.1 type II secretion system protein M [Pseudidiomarina sp. 1APP75-32.1]MDN7129256.1 type II secretion system protein M [Pseudidiomarina sp. 1APR75-15]MDN7134478.1 type II secretion system protein M [Pseudidiomarina sp. 1ASP75-5]MDN7136833.1 type II secretion system protein M [Pseudidiomarina sp. 1ASP75-14]MEA3587727.1 type II secretion system protein M [Pseudidiomarina sp. 1APP75-27a]